MNTNEKKADRIMAWISKKAKDNYFNTPCGCSGINGVRSDELVSYMKQYHPEQVDWIKELETPQDEEGEFVWLEIDLLAQIVEGYLGGSIRWSKDLNRYAVVVA